MARLTLRAMTLPNHREEALRRLSVFVPKSGRDYAARRNLDLPGHPHVSALSPYIRHRLVTEEEVLHAILGRHAFAAAEKSVQEVFWRTYWKGWLELRPSVWVDYRRCVKGALDRVQAESGLRRGWEAACRGETGIDAFDHWTRELADTGYLHNHARMWFASIWIFTLRLPWELGADFFLRHLLDGDPASNTLSWRWVAGLQTPGKHYLARPDNIATYTAGRFHPTGLDITAAPLQGSPPPPSLAPPAGDVPDPGKRTGLILTEDDLAPGFLLDRVRPRGTLVLLSHARRSPLAVSQKVVAFTTGAAQDAIARHEDRLGPVTFADTAQDAARWAAAFDQIVTPYAPTGPARDTLDGLTVPVLRILRPFDAKCWPHATAGFFRFKDRIPAFVADLKCLRAA
jgi:deoxyribodipyrimidine photo-lyase